MNAMNDRQYDVSSRYHRYLTAEHKFLVDFSLLELIVPRNGEESKEQW